jgi:hypothetical protein
VLLNSTLKTALPAVQGILKGLYNNFPATSGIHQRKGDQNLHKTKIKDIATGNLHIKQLFHVIPFATDRQDALTAG